MNFSCCCSTCQHHNSLVSYGYVLLSFSLFSKQTKHLYDKILEVNSHTPFFPPFLIYIWSTNGPLLTPSQNCISQLSRLSRAKRRMVTAINYYQKSRSHKLGQAQADYFMFTDVIRVILPCQLCC